jgi:hypothetical protein
MANLLGESTDPKVPAVVAKHATNGIGVKASAGAGGYAGEFSGDVKVNGILTAGQASINKNVILLWGGAKNAYTIALNAENGLISMANPDDAHYTIMLDGRNNKIDMGSAHIDGNKGSFSVGQASIDKNVILLSGGPKNAYTIALNAENGLISMANPDDAHYTIMLDGRNNKIDMGSAHIDGNKGSFSVGQASIDKNVLLLSGGPQNAYTIALDAENGLFSMASPDDAHYTIMLDGRNNKIDVGGVHIDGNAGDISLDNADCAEDFEVSEMSIVEAGTVMALNDVGQLEQSTVPYDKRVVGVVSGAGDLKPGLILGRKTGLKDRLPIALMGRVHCKVDADYGSIEVGDLLTTSATLGYAMKASDPARSFGAVIGKALRPLKNGRDLIPILVALQ